MIFAFMGVNSFLLHTVFIDDIVFMFVAVFMGDNAFLCNIAFLSDTVFVDDIYSMGNAIFKGDSVSSLEKKSSF